VIIEPRRRRTANAPGWTGPPGPVGSWRPERGRRTIAGNAKQAATLATKLSASPTPLARLLAWMRAWLAGQATPASPGRSKTRPGKPARTAAALRAGETPARGRRRAVSDVAVPAPGRRKSASVVRRPLLGRRGEVAGFEFVVIGQRVPQAAIQADPALAAEQAIALLGAMRPSLQAGQFAIATIPLEVLAMPVVIEHMPVDAHIAFPDLLELDQRRTALLETVRRRGGVPGGYGVPFQGARFVVIEGDGLDSAGLGTAAEAARRAIPGIEVVAVGLPDVDAVEAALANAVDFAGGSLERRRASRSTGEMPAQAQRACELINSVLTGTELPELAAILRADVGLSYQLLRYVNSAWIALPRTAQSVDDAVMLIGRDGLFRWLTQLLAAEAPPRPSSRALQEIAIARGRLMELLAESQAMPGTPPFTTGLLSLLDAMMGLPIGEALAPLHLPQPALRALVNGDGPWHPMLDLVRRLEQRDMQAATELAELFGGLEKVSAMADEAWKMARAASAAPA
jgi:EAL and modified HD-GYP domain-containing signal transduction protein